MNIWKDLVAKAFDVMCEANANYQKLLIIAIEQCGEVAVIDENESFEDDETPCYNVEYYDGERVWRYSVDKLKVEDGNIMFHAIKMNWNEVDDWIPTDWIGDQRDFLFESIVWPGDE